MITAYTEYSGRWKPVRIICVVLFLFLLAVGESALGQDIAKPEPGSITEGIPPIPSSLVAEVARYTNIRSAEILAWHPTRREMLIATFMCTTAQVYQVKFPGGREPN